MKTENHSINDVLAKNATSFFIPPFQRAYAWGKSEIERYFSDVIRIIESEMDANQHDKLEHFFGTVVIKEEKAGFSNKSIVVDGQQRLTTTLIFLIALRDCESDTLKKDFITNNYLTNSTSTFQDKIKLKQVTKDWDAYKALVNKSDVNNGIIRNAYNLFYKMVTDIRKTRPQIKLEHYITAIQRMNIAVIFLDERPHKGEDPQIIFETLNSLGRPLTLSDLVRNYVLLNMDSESQSQVYENIWHPEIELRLHNKTSEFFRDFLQLKTSGSIKAVSDNNTKEIYHLFKSFVEDNYVNHKTFIEDIIKYVQPYEWIISDYFIEKISENKIKNDEILELLRNIFHDIKTEAFKPFVMGLLYKHQHSISLYKLSDDSLISILRIIRTYLIRRRIIKLTQGENKSIVMLCNRIEDLATTKVSMIDLLSNMYYKMRLPNDEEMKSTLISLNFYEELKQYSKFILGKIEENRTKVAVDFRNPKITIEHIMPQKLNDTWISDLGDSHDEIHKKYLHNIGNLILTEFNSEMGNKSFSEKKSKLHSSSLSFRLSILDKDIWNFESILNHQKNMIEWFLVTFSLPDVYKNTSNWNSKAIDVSLFSPLDVDAGNLAEGNKPLELLINNEKIKVSTWQDVFIKLLKYIMNTNTEEFNFIIENQTLLFSREDVIVTWSTLEKILDKKFELANRYKSFEGQVWDKVNYLDYSTWFLHINISASTCIARVANIMNKLNMDKDSVIITLK